MCVNTQEQGAGAGAGAEAMCQQGWMADWLDGWMNFGIFLHVHHLAAECQNASRKHARQWSRNISMAEQEDMEFVESCLLAPPSTYEYSCQTADSLSCCLACAGACAIQYVKIVSITFKQAKVRSSELRVRRT